MPVDGAGDGAREGVRRAEGFTRPAGVSRFLLDTGITATQGIPGLLHGGSDPVGRRSPRSARTSMPRRAALRRPGRERDGTSRWTNLNTFSGRGGKLIFYHGVSDPWFSALDTVDYYERLTKANGGPEQVRNWSRLFLSPGMGHCGAGPSLDTFDALTAVVDWVEKGVAPASIPATGRAFPGRSRPLVAYPRTRTTRDRATRRRGELRVSAVRRPTGVRLGADLWDG